MVHGQGELTIDLEAIAENYRRIVAHAAPAEVAAVVKADAYGLGVDEVAPALWNAGARRFFVATLDEGIALRKVLVNGEIFVLSGLSNNTILEYEDGRLTPVLNSLAEIAIATARARSRGRPLPGLVHIDTGMNRLGLDRVELATLQAAPDRLAGIRLQGWMSHLATADQPDHPMTEAQLGRFQAALRGLPAAPASLATSAGVWRDRRLHFDIVRPGCALYGLRPLADQPNPMRRVVRLSVPVLQVRSVDTGETVGYGATFRAEFPTKIATVSVGYADGFIRSSGASRTVRIGSASVPVVGRVSMDLMTIDVGFVAEDIEPGTMVELIGEDHDADALADEIGTIGYEVLTALGRRFRRRYLPAAAAGAAGPTDPEGVKLAASIR